MCSTRLRIGLAVCDVLKLDPHRFVPLRPEELTALQGEAHDAVVETPIGSTMKKYLVFRPLGRADEDVEKHELVAVEYGANINAVTDKLIRAINEDATGLPQYQTGFYCGVDSPEEIGSGQLNGPFQYVITAILQPDCGAHNDLLEYMIAEEDTSEATAKI